MMRREGMDRRGLNSQSWQSVLSLFYDMLTTVHGSMLTPIIHIIEDVKRRNLDEQYYASQSVGRLVVRRTDHDELDDYVMVFCNKDSTLLCQRYMPSATGPVVVEEIVCPPEAVLDFITSRLGRPNAGEVF
jgi:hypothetical protein